MDIKNNPNVIFKPQPAKFANRYTIESKKLSVKPHGEKVDISLRARELQQALKDIKKIPDVRTELVERVKIEVVNGTYKIYSHKVAGEILKEGFENTLALEMERTVRPPKKRGKGEGHGNGNGTIKPPKK